MKGRESMSRLLLLSHANLCMEFFKTVELLIGKMDERVDYIPLPYGADISKYQQLIEDKVMEAKDEGILIITDLFGGSPFMISTRVYGKLQDQTTIEIITGMNLPMVVELMTNLDKPVSELKAIAMDTGPRGIIDFSKMMNRS